MCHTSLSLNFILQYSIFHQPLALCNHPLPILHTTLPTRCVPPEFGNSCCTSNVAKNEKISSFASFACIVCLPHITSAIDILVRSTQGGNQWRVRDDDKFTPRGTQANFIWGMNKYSICDLCLGFSSWANTRALKQTEKLRYTDGNVTIWHLTFMF